MERVKGTLNTLFRSCVLPRCIRNSLCESFAGGEGWIRTIVGVSQQIYSLPPLATRAPLRSEDLNYEAFTAICQDRYLKKLKIQHKYLIFPLQQPILRTHLAEKNRYTV